LNGRVCFLSRAGDGLAGVRLVGTRSDEVWDARPSEGADVLSVQADARSAAAWISERATTGGVGLLCVDVDGSNCRWLSSATADPVLVAAALDRGDGTSSGSGGAGIWADQNPSMASIQALVGSGPAVKRARTKGPQALEERRLPVLAVPDTLARLVIDELDDRGIAVEHAASLWHAIALAWDPASPVLSTVRSSGDVVEGAAPVSAVVLADPVGGGGRLLWAWSRAGELLAGGVLLAGSSGEGGLKLGRSDVGRLAADWLGWSMQLGVSPSRIVCVAPPMGSGTDDDMKPAQLGAAIGKSWSGAMVDMAVHEDPIGATLSRLATSESALAANDARSSLLTLSRRSGRIHRSMYLWISLAMAAAGAGLLGVGVRAWSGAGKAGIERDAIVAKIKKQVLDVAPPPSGDTLMLAMASDNPRSYLESQIELKRKINAPDTGLPPARPILAELESLSFVLGTNEIEIDEIQINESLQDVQVWVADTKVAEALKDSLDHVANDYCDWTLNLSPGGRTRNNMQFARLSGTWKQKTPVGGSAAGGGGKP